MPNSAQSKTHVYLFIINTPYLRFCIHIFNNQVACILSHFSHVQLFATIWTVAHQAPLSMGISRQEYWSGLPFPSLVSISRCFSGILLLLYDSGDVDNLISGSSAFSKTSLNIRKFTVHVFLKPGLENFEHYFTSV